MRISVGSRRSMDTARSSPDRLAWELPRSSARSLGMGRPVHRLALSVSTLLGVMVVTACEATPTYKPATIPSGAQAVPIRLLSAHGTQGSPPPYVVAATSVASLELLVDARYQHRPGYAGFDHWGPIPGLPGDVLLALPVDQDGYEIESIAAWRGSGNTIMIAEGLLRPCNGGECTAPRVAMYLAIVPRTALPDATVTFQVVGESTRSAVDLGLGASPALPGA